MKEGADIPDLIEKKGSPFGCLEDAGLVPDGAREGSFHVPEELALEKRFGDRRAVDANKGLFASGAQGMNGTRGELLSRAGLAREEDRHITLGSKAQPSEDFLHPPAFSDQSLKGAATLRLLFEDRNLFVCKEKRREVGEGSNGADSLPMLVRQDPDISVEVKLTPIVGQDLALLVAEAGRWRG